MLFIFSPIFPDSKSKINFKINVEALANVIIGGIGLLLTGGTKVSFLSFTAYFHNYKSV